MEKVKVIGSPLYQWELGRVVEITPPDNTIVSKVEFSQAIDTEALCVIPREENGVIVADIPNILLQSGSPIFVYLVYADGQCLETTASYVLSVVKRPKPADYVYTETEVLTWQALDERLKAVEENEVDPEAIGKAVDEYMTANPLAETDPTVPEWAKAESKPAYTAEEVGALSKDTVLVGKAGTGTNAEVFNGGVAENAAGDYSHAEGRGTVASARSQSVSGEYNIDNLAYTVKEGYTSSSVLFANTKSFYLAKEYSFNKRTGLFELVDPFLVSAAKMLSSYYTEYAGYYFIYDSKITPEATTGEKCGYASVAATTHNSSNYRFSQIGFFYRTATTEDRGAYAHIIGNGTDDENRSNAHTVDWDGNAWYQGEVYVGGTSQDDGERLAKASELPDLTEYAKTADVPTDDHINELINTALGVIENGTY